MNFPKIGYKNSDPLYLQVTNIIENMIVNKEIKVDEKLPPEDELCKKFGVSVDTVRGALSKLVDEGYLFRRPRHGTIVINSKPKKGLALTKENAVCLIVCPAVRENPAIEPAIIPYYFKIIKGVEEKIKEKDFYLIYNVLNGNEISLAGKEKDVAGLVVTGTITPEVFQIIKKSRIPFVLIGDVGQKKITNGDTDIVTDDEFTSSYIATKHLIDLGHKRIMFFADSVDKYSWHTERFRGYEKAHKEENIIIDKELLIETGKLDLDIGYHTMKELLEKQLSFTGLVAFSHNLCFGAMKAIREKDLGIPKDISVISPMIQEEMVKNNEPHLTTLNGNIEELGRTAVGQLIKKINIPDWKPQRIVLPRELFVRGSTARVGSGKNNSGGTGPSRNQDSVKLSI